MRKRKRVRAVIDTNLWISFLIGKSFIDFKQIIAERNTLILYSQELLAELQLVLNREKFRKYFDKESIQKIKDIFDLNGEEIETKSEVLISRDPKDNFLLELSIDGKADYLITGDKELLSLKKFAKTKIITYNSFAKENLRKK
jgi:hypothetical protein